MRHAADWAAMGGEVHQLMAPPQQAAQHQMPKADYVHAAAPTVQQAHYVHAAAQAAAAAPPVQHAHHAYAAAQAAAAAPPVQQAHYVLDFDPGHATPPIIGPFVAKYWKLQEQKTTK